MKFLVTGGTGFIGSALCKRLINEGHAVDVLTRDAEAARQVLPVGAVPIENLEKLEQSPQVIVNLAGKSLGSGRWNDKLKQEFIDSRVGMTERLLDYIKTCSERPTVLISGSAVGYYGACNAQPLSEEARPGNEYQSRLCQRWEDAALKAEPLGLRVCRIRIGAVLGPGGGPLQSMLPSFKFFAGGWFGSGKQMLSWIHREDLIRIIIFLAEKDTLTGAFNATAPNPVTNKTFSKALGRALNRPVWAWVPAPVVRLLLGGMARLILTGQNVIPKRLLDANFKFNYPEVEPALRDAVRAKD